jgi:hypothetical protein
MIMDIATEEIGHVEMLTTMLARLRQLHRGRHRGLQRRRREPACQPHLLQLRPGERGRQGPLAQGPTRVGDKEIVYVPDAQPLTDDKPLGPAPDPKPFVTYDGSMGKGKPSTGAGAHAQGVANLVNKIKGAID